MAAFAGASSRSLASHRSRHGTGLDERLSSMLLAVHVGGFYRDGFRSGFLRWLVIVPAPTGACWEVSLRFLVSILIDEDPDPGLIEVCSGSFLTWLGISWGG